MKKNNDKRNETLMKADLNLNMDDVAEAMVQAVNKLPILTEAEVDELREASEGMMNRMEGKGCWIGLGLVRKADRDPSLLSAVYGNFSTLARMVAEALDKDPVLEKVFLVALALKKIMDKMAETEDNEDEDNNEEEE